MAQFVVNLSDGRQVTVESDKEPTENDLASALAAPTQTSPPPSLLPSQNGILNITPDALQQEQNATGTTDPRNESFESYAARNPSESDQLIKKLAPTIKTPEQQEQFGKLVADKTAPQLPVQSTGGQAWQALWSPPTSIKDFVDIQRGVDQNNEETDKQLRALAVKHGLDPDKYALNQSVPSQVIEGAGNSILDLALTFTSPGGIATLGMGALPKAAQKAASLAFGAQMIAQTPEIASQILDEIRKPADQRDYRKIAQLTVSGLANTGFSALSFNHAANIDTKPSTPESESSNASNEPSAAQLPVRNEGETVGGQAPLQQSGQAASPPSIESDDEITPASQTRDTASDTGEQDQENDVTPADLVPALKTDDGVIFGNPGETHADIRARVSADPTVSDKVKGDVNEAIFDDANHVFADKDGNVFDRQAAADALGEDKPLQSERLRELQADGTEDEIKPGTNPTPEYESVANMTPKEFDDYLKLNKAGATDAGYNLSDILQNDEERSRVETLSKAEDAAQSERMKAMTVEPDREKQLGMMNEVMLGNSKKQYFNEAVRMYDAVKAVQGGEMDITAAGKKFGVLERNLSDHLKPSEPAPPEPTEVTPPTTPETKAPAGGVASPVEEPEMIGMGAAKIGEVAGEGDASVTGLADRVRKQREAYGQTAPTVPGEGLAPEVSVERGRQLIQSGADPEKTMSDFESTGRFSSDDFAVVRAKTEQLSRATNQAEEKFGTDSQEFKDASKTESDWSARTKKMQTEWARSGHAQQGQVDIDTGTFSGLRRAFRDSNEEDFTPQQAKAAKDISNKVKIAANESVKAQSKLYSQLELSLGNVDVPIPKNLDEARMLFSKYKEGNKFTPQQVKTIWNSAKKFYLEKGVTNFHDVVNGLATDFGLKVNDVRTALAQPKGIKSLTDEAFRKQQVARRLDQTAKRWLKETTTPLYRKAINSIPQILFGLKVGFHGTVALGTHAPFVAFQPPFWLKYIKDFGKMYRMVGSRAYYETQVQDLLRRPNYITARRAGLVNDPNTVEDFNSPEIVKYMAGLTQMGNRGYSVLKILRQDMFDQHWGNLPKSAQIPEVAKAIADGVNHATGVVKVNAPKGASVALFAPRLEMSRAAWLAVDPIKSANTFLNWKNASEGDKVFAINQIKEKAWVAGTLLGLLALNQGVLSATGSKQKINLTDPMKSDWMKFKAAGMDISYGNALISMARLPVRLYQIRSSDGGKLKNLVFPDEDTYTVLGQYARSQMSPFASLATDLWLKGDWENRPLPNSSRPVPKRLQAQGVKPYTWPEFWSEQVLPIPAEEAVREVWQHGLGMKPEQVTAARKALATIAIMAATGARLADDVQPKVVHNDYSE